ncbi:uncharacterized protein K444DRAFT_619463 [Hyaloscypha bicolor E]|uniref:Uncharacterized protein n=1 Tax=Hyaloscypha bicolor E TaxID=1095630 RepID=A0A2J6SPQ4_9HELO|nr:uncharacterized protein K444DRAFT_619463 [Hyaloscypha bicolor E]PMD52755.1 hypothetical protein K444DRAFT_619463 [Hyaloscypha bicolor E]
MPLYTLHLYQWNATAVDNSIEKSFQKSVHQPIASLHSTTFPCDPSTVRVEFMLPCGESHSRGYGGYGYDAGKDSMFSDKKKLSDFMVVNMDFRGSAKEWQDYCQRLVRLPNLRGRNLRSVFLQRNLYEFEISDVKFPGVVVGIDERMDEQEELPSYQQQLA